MLAPHQYLGLLPEIARAGAVELGDAVGAGRDLGLLPPGVEVRARQWLIRIDTEVFGEPVATFVVGGQRLRCFG